MAGAGAWSVALLAGCVATRENAASTPEQQGALPTRALAPGTASDGPLPTLPPLPTATALPGPTLAEMVGGILLLGFRGTTLTSGNPIVADIRDRHLGGIILFSFDVAANSPVRNIQSPAQVAQLTADLQLAAGGRKLLIATDQEGGLVARLGPDHGFPATPSHAALGAIGDANRTRTVAAGMGATLAAAGINWDLAPVFDVNVNLDNPVIGGIDRSFSADPGMVSAQALAFIDGLHSAGILTSAKHFPGHGSSLDDSHAGFADVTNTWSASELRPYQDLIPTGKVDSVLVAHVFNANLDTDYPASLSAKVIEGMLRGDLGYEGVVVSDDMQMGAITQEYGFRDALRLALLAGNDVLTLGNNLIEFQPDLGALAHSTVMDLVRAGDVPESRIREAYLRVEALRARAG